MKPFMDADFLLSTPTARMLYHNYAQAMPIVDYHCHVDPREIFEDRRFENIYQTWLEGDHYKWRLMRGNGVDERYITGDAPQREKFQQFAQTLPRAIGNPMYHWCHLELKKYFGYEGVLNGDTAQKVWDLSVQKLAERGMSVRGLLEQSKVAFLGTTDDPTSNLEWHKKIAADAAVKTVVAPSFRPDKALNIDKAGWKAFLDELAAVSGVSIDALDALEQALARRMEAFADAGCKASDHGLDYMLFRRVPRAEAEAALQKGLRGEAVTAEEAEGLKTELLLFCAKQYVARGWVMQLHFNCKRNPNSAMFERLGSDAGFDSMNAVSSASPLYALLNWLYRTDSLPRTILYSLNPGENEVLDTAIGAFQGTEVAGKLQHGSGWWFNDTKSGMVAQMTSLANLGILGNFVGMLTDSRSFLSYTRHAYFRRILCELIGTWVENGEYPDDLDAVGGLVRDICYHNAARYFRLEDQA